jgi:hypothetical protein
LTLVYDIQYTSIVERKDPDIECRIPTIPHKQRNKNKGNLNAYHISDHLFHHDYVLNEAECDELYLGCDSGLLY